MKKQILVMLMNEKRKFVQEYFKNLLKVQSAEQRYLYIRGMQDGIERLKAMGVLA